MPRYLITCVCDEGLSETSFVVVEAESRLAIAQQMLDKPYEWRRFLERTPLWWELTYYEYKYGRPRGWSAADLLAQIDKTHVDGDSSFQLRIHEITTVRCISPGPRPEDVDAAALVNANKPDHPTE